MQKMLLALQYWEGDKQQAMQLARLITDLQPGRCENADFLFVARFDCTHDAAEIARASTKFNVHHYINRHRRGTQWPHGCNDLWFGTMDWIWSHMEAQRIPEYKCILTFEADSVPLTPNWISELSQAWDESRPANVVGPLLDYPAPHVNGNAMFSGDKKFLKWITRDIGGCRPNGGWDYVLAPKFKQQGWADCPLMRSWWKTPTLTPEMFKGLMDQGAAFLHGVKDDSAIRAVRERFAR